jgi:hypothetical protein
VEAILKKRVRGEVEQYLVKWKGYPENQSTWEPKDHMTDCASLILEFELAQLPQQARDDLAESEEPFRPSSDPLPPSLYDHNLTAVLPASTLVACHAQLDFLRAKMEKEAVLLANEKIGEILECDQERGGTIWFGVRLVNGQLRRVRKVEVMKTSKHKLVQFYEQLIRWSN